MKTGNHSATGETNQLITIGDGTTPDGIRGAPKCQTSKQLKRESVEEEASEKPNIRESVN
jgi:hypothetical protein